MKNKFLNKIKHTIDRHPRIDYQKTIISLWKTKRKSVLKYENPSDNTKAWRDLVLRDSKGKEIARVMTYGTFGNNDLRYNK